jgi:hypothetical protein
MNAKSWQGILKASNIKLGLQSSDKTSASNENSNRTTSYTTTDNQSTGFYKQNNSNSDNKLNSVITQANGTQMVVTPSMLFGVQEELKGPFLSEQKEEDFGK